MSKRKEFLPLPAVIQSYLNSKLDRFENRISPQLFKQAVERNMGLSTLVDSAKVAE